MSKPKQSLRAQLGGESRSYRSGFNKGVDYALRRSKGELGLENPFEPDYVEYEAYWDGSAYAQEKIDELKAEKLFN